MTKESAKAKGLSFRWNYIVLPAAILLLSVFLSIYFYRLLPAEIAYHFKFDGTPDRWLGRGVVVAWTLIPQLILTLLAGAAVWIITKMSIFSRHTESTWIKPKKILLFMGNMIALPQFVLFFAMLDIFSYNSYQTHYTIWVFAPE